MNWFELVAAFVCVVCLFGVAFAAGWYTGTAPAAGEKRALTWVFAVVGACIAYALLSQLAWRL